jgi:hypothetical protein
MCLNCGSPLDLPEAPADIDMAHLPPVQAPPAGGVGWSAVVASPRATARSRWSGAATFVGVIAVAAFIVSLLMFSTAEATTAPSAALVSILFALWIISGAFWLWMLIDAISESRVLWALAIFLLGVFGALGYALLGKSPRTARY